MNKIISPIALVEWSGGFLEAFRAANKDSSLADNKGSYSAWPPLRPGVIAISVDAAIDPRGSRFRTGCVIRDHNGVGFGFGSLG